MILYWVRGKCCPVQCRMFSSSPDSYLLYGNSTLPLVVTIKNVSGHLPYGQNYPHLRTTELNWGNRQNTEEILVNFIREIFRQLPEWGLVFSELQPDSLDSTLCLYPLVHSEDLAHYFRNSAEPKELASPPHDIALLPNGGDSLRPPGFPCLSEVAQNDNSLIFISIICFSWRVRTKALRDFLTSNEGYCSFKRIIKFAF